MRRLLTFLVIASALLAASPASADEATRRVQEELRKRRLYNGDIDGQQTAELGVALKQYQERKGFPASGVVDAQTLRAMGITEAQTGDDLPDVPVLRSDRGVKEGGGGKAEFGSLATAPSSSTAPPPSREELQEFVSNYFAACETPAANDELSFFAPRVEYFDHGVVSKSYIRNELVAYNQHWPDRKYVIGDAVRMTMKGRNVSANCRVGFDLANTSQNRQAAGQVDQTMVLARQADSTLEIVSLKEKRIPAAIARRRPAKKDPVGRTFRKAQRSIRKLFR